jgi:ABC transport system ATP-binding/permease protein
MSEDSRRPVPGELTVIVDGRESRFPPGSRVVIGRAADSTVVLTGSEVSRRHLEVVDHGGWILQDLDSGNGTWHEAKRITARPLGPGLSVRLGHPARGPLVEFLTAPRDAALQGTVDFGPDGRAAWDPVQVGDALTIGRALDNDLVLADPLVSRHHARIRATRRGHRVKNLTSANLTFVNSTFVTSTRLNDGDVLTCGGTRMVLVGDRLHPLPGGDEAGLVVDGLMGTERSGPAVSELTLKGLALLGVIGPKGARKSTLLRLLAGELVPAHGRVRYQSQDVHANPAVRARIGLALHEPPALPRCTARQALSDAAELRLPPDTAESELAARVDEVLDELELTGQADVRVNALPGDGPQRLSIGIELLTRPSLLLVDEPAAGLDPGLSLSMMQLLRRLADNGRQVIVTTQDLADPELFDSVLVLAPGGQEAYSGPPDGIRRRFGTTAWPVIFTGLSKISVAREGLLDGSPQATPRTVRTPLTPLAGVLLDPTTGQRALDHARVVARRQVRVLATHWRFTALLVLMPFVVAILAVAGTAGSGLGPPRTGDHSDAVRLITVLVAGAVFMGVLVSTRGRIGDRSIYLHERSAGLLPEGYLAGKATVLGGIAAIQAVTSVVFVFLARPGPGSALVLGLPIVEVAVAVAATGVAGCCLGLAVSALSGTAERTVLALVILGVAQVFLCGGLISLTNDPYLALPSALMPTRWGYAAVAATVDLRRLDPGVPGDGLWQHTAFTWLSCLSALIVLGIGFLAVTLWRLRR